jgi:Uma2 family endonuclease
MHSARQIPNEKDPFADRKRWTAEDCRRIEAMGLLEPGTYELLDGEVVEKLGQNVAHSLACKRTFLALSLVFGSDHVMLPVSVIVSDEDRPEPDVFVTKLPDQDYVSRGNPTPSDMNLIVEVSDTTLWRDRNTKARLYGVAGVADYWVLDVNNRRLFVYRYPSPTGYPDPLEYEETQSVAPLAAPNSPIRVSDLLP